MKEADFGKITKKNLFKITTFVTLNNFFSRQKLIEMKKNLDLLSLNLFYLDQFEKNVQDNDICHLNWLALT